MSDFGNQQQQPVRIVGTSYRRPALATTAHAQTHHTATGINHTSAAINGFSVNRNGGHNIGPYGGGGTQMCCAVLPLQWREGLTVVVEWEKDPLPHDYGNWLEPLFSDAWSARMKVHQSKYTRHSAVVEVAPYQELGVVTVHFLPWDQVKVAAGTTYDGLAEHPYQYPRRMEVPSTSIQGGPMYTRCAAKAARSVSAAIWRSTFCCAMPLSATC